MQREKERILYLYNDMTKKRRSYLRHMRKVIRRKAREQELKVGTGRSKFRTEN